MDLVKLIFHKSFIVFCLVISLNVLLFFGHFNVYVNNQKLISLNEFQTNDRPIKNYTNNNQICKLPQLDPWDISIRQYLNSNNNPLAGCTPSFELRSFIDSGRLWVNDSKSGIKDWCFFRCLFAAHDYRIKFNKWKMIEKTEGAFPKCDIVEVRCEIDENTATTYKYLHAQIYEEDPPDTEAQKDIPDVHIVILDAVSTSHYRRALPLTSQYLKNYMNAVDFPYLNKIGHNSRPNLYAFLMGVLLLFVNQSEQPGELSSKQQNEENVRLRLDDICEEPLDNRTLLAEFKRRGYKTLLADDWEASAFNYPDCVGFDHTSISINHPFRHFTLRTDDFSRLVDLDLRQNIFNLSCVDWHEPAWNFWKQFLYKAKSPKMSLLWMNFFAHDDINNLFYADKMFRDFFASHQEQLSNSFIFFMSDHGALIDYISDTNIGKLEANNPFLSLIVPERLRSNSHLIEKMYKNSHQLVTHFDIYSTLVDIIENSRNWKDTTDFAKNYKSSHKFGSSLLRPLPQPRNCESLGVPFEYCLCEQEYKKVQNATLALEIAKLVVTKMNREIKQKGFSKKCVKLSVDKNATSNFKLQMFMPQNGQQRVKAQLKVQPSGGVYIVFAKIHDNGEIKLVGDRFPRKDRYAEQSKCIPDTFFKNYCYCFDLIKTNK